MRGHITQPERGDGLSRVSPQHAPPAVSQRPCATAVPLTAAPPPITLRYRPITLRSIGRSHCVTGRSHCATGRSHCAHTALHHRPITLRYRPITKHPCAIIGVLKGSQSVLSTASVAKRRPYAIIRVLKGSPSVPHSIGSATLSVLQSQALPALSGMKNPAGGMPPAGCFARGRDHIRHAAIRTGIKPRGQDQAISISVTGLTKSCLSRRKSSSITASTSVPALSLYNTTSFAASSVR